MGEAKTNAATAVAVDTRAREGMAPITHRTSRLFPTHAVRTRTRVRARCQPILRSARIHLGAIDADGRAGRCVALLAGDAHAYVMGAVRELVAQELKLLALPNRRVEIDVFLRA